MTVEIDLRLNVWRLHIPFFINYQIPISFFILPLLSSLIISSLFHFVSKEGKRK